jgi:hypothetical protein
VSCSFGPPWRVVGTSATACKQLMSHKYYADKKKTNSSWRLYSMLLKAGTAVTLLTNIVVTFFHSSLVQEASGVRTLQSCAT